MRSRFKTSIIIVMLGFPSVALAELISLEQVITEVCTKSDSVKSMKESLNKSKQLIREQYSAAFPDISMQLFGGGTFARGMGKSSGGMNFSKDPSASATMGDVYSLLGSLGSSLESQSKSAASSIYNSSIQLTQPIYTFGKVGTAVNVAKYYDSSMQFNYKRNIQQLQLLALDAYYRVVLLQMALSITERSSNRKKDLSEFLTRNFELGSGSKAQILATNADLASLWPILIEARQEVNTARQQLCVLMGRQINDSITLDTILPMNNLFSDQLPSKDIAVQTALTNRQDLQSLEQIIKANEGGAKIFKAMYYPSIAGQASFGFGGKDPEDLFDWDKRTWTVGVAFSWAFFDGYANSAKSQQYLSDSRKLEIARGSISKFLEIEVEAAISECIAADSNLAAAKVVLSSIKEAFELTDENFKQGSGQFAELQLAEERLHQGEMGIVSARYRLIRSRAALQVSMGKSIISTEEK